MYEDVEADFWKDIFVHLQHKNMMRMGTGAQEDNKTLWAEKLSVSNAQEQFDIFHKRNPNVAVAVEGSSSYFTWEVFVTATIKLRLFIQNQIKCSLMQNISGDFTKIADAKFPNNPFPEIEEFLSKRENYTGELSVLKDKTIRSKKQMKIAGEFIKAFLGKKFAGSETVWYLEPGENNFLLKIDLGNGDEKIVKLSVDNFVQEVNNFVL